ncbi:hypothetical protein PO124_08850 [Bacillus licheniformis]|nr:hypothetical protein [Bacillus licheniformis]
MSVWRTSIPSPSILTAKNDVSGPSRKRDKYKGIKDDTKVEVEYTKAEDGTLQLEDMKRKNDRLQKGL